MTTSTADQYLAAQATAATSLDALDFVDPPVAFVYNPLLYAKEPHECFVRLYLDERPKRLLFLGMNPGPFGMAQTGVPFGDAVLVREFLKVTGEVFKPPREHPKRPVGGLACRRSEVSGVRFWGLIKEITDGRPERFFANCFVHNYCPLMFLEKSGKNVAPATFRKNQPIQEVNAICDQLLLRTVQLLRPTNIVCVGKFALDRARNALKLIDSEVTIQSIAHPSPANPASNRAPGWKHIAIEQLKSIGVYDLLMEDSSSPSLISEVPSLSSTFE
uniref:Uracil-DNA glycosylase-like domain-containing protein n=1 Tax=Plectus sambesii TaxID=2011161 RepID=A0A914VZN3_9BILA